MANCSSIYDSRESGKIFSLQAEVFSGIFSILLLLGMSKMLLLRKKLKSLDWWLAIPERKSEDGETGNPDQ